jgi:hypothetical protein
MEILFPDVVGSGGAPKRIMKPRRRNPDGTFPPKQPSTIDTSIVDPNLDSPSSSVYNQTTSQNLAQQQQQQPTPSTSQPIQRPTSTSVPPRTTAIPNTSALTPPEETTPHTESRKRPNPDPTPASAERRRGRPSRFAPSFYGQAPRAPTPSTSAGASFSANPNNPTTSSLISSGLAESAVLALAEALKGRSPPKWPEQAVEILFREFADEDLDLQLKIAEKALTDENKAMVFVKMTPLLRRHWVSRLRDVHMRNLGGGGLGLGRVGEEAS